MSVIEREKRDETDKRRPRVEEGDLVYSGRFLFFFPFFFS